ncbi:MAG: hypothetical protein HY934_03575 [Candidatus Firestonebacteria bacterium]|nr:hypothetical protein [Candidatus Firestonebacteria bacterium]
MAKQKVLINPEIENFSEKLAQNPASRIFAPLADAYRKSGMLDEAVEVCMKGLKFHPNYMSAHVVLGKIYLQKEMLEEARKEFEKVLEIDADNLVALTMLGEILMKLNCLVEAVDKFEKILKLDPFNDNAKKALEDIKIQKKSNVIEKEVDIYNVYQEEATKEKQKEQDKLKELQKRSRRFRDDDDINTLTMATLYFKQGMFLEAEKVCKKILIREPDNSEVKTLLHSIISRDSDKEKIEKTEVQQKPIERSLRDFSPFAEIEKKEKVIQKENKELNLAPEIHTETIEKKPMISVHKIFGDISSSIDSKKVKERIIKEELQIKKDGLEIKKEEVKAKKEETVVIKEPVKEPEYIKKEAEDVKPAKAEVISPLSDTVVKNEIDEWGSFIKTINEKDNIKLHPEPPKRVIKDIKKIKPIPQVPGIKPGAKKSSSNNPMEDWLDLIKAEGER